MRKPGLYTDIDIEQYHADEGISSTGISLILDCPKRYWYEYLSGMDSQKPCRAFDLGSALHTSILEPEKFKELFHMAQESYDLRTKVGKEAHAAIELEAKGRTIIRGQDVDTLSYMIMAVRAHSVWKKINIAEGKVENSIYWDGGIYQTRLKARPDFFNDNLIIDLKTTDSIAGFSRSVYSYGYHRQAAMQVDALSSIDDKKRFFAFFVVEKKAPFLTACFTLDEEALELGRKEYLDGAATYSECLKVDIWPGYEEKFQLLSLPKWALKKEESENE
jgi:hypothetical protein